MKKKGKGQLKPAAHILQELLEGSNSSISNQFMVWKLLREWPQVMGEKYAKNTEPTNLVGRILYIWVPNSTWLQEMNFVAAPIKDRINKFAGREWIREVRFTLKRKDQQAVENFKKNFKGII